MAAVALVAAESILALTPVVIKKTPLDPISTIWSRILSSAAIGSVLVKDKSMNRKEWIGAGALGYTNLLHIASSYESFRHLAAGQAMSLLYTYPLWILVFEALFRDEQIKASEYGLIGAATVGSLLLNLDPGHVQPAVSSVDGKVSKPWGILMGLVMAITEAGMHTILKGLNWLDPAKSVFVVNASAGFWLAGFLGLQSLIGDAEFSVGLRSGTWVDAAWLTAFHGITLFSGYWLRFYAVPRLSAVTYSILSYAGLVAAYVFGLTILGERPSWMSLIGAAIILSSGYLLQRSEK